MSRELGVMSSEKEVFSFENLNVYKKALVFADQVYEITRTFPNNERFVLVDQFRRAAISISLNIAEGCGGSSLEFKRYLKIAKGSIRECIAIMAMAKLRKYMDCNEEKRLRNDCVEISKMLSGLIASLK